ncbi:sulfite exporter TauE/SafE family protein [Achromobacter deleyi]|uniref:sulfite exporter TauE/SafE family protein n=1 Tax=Achromobacter deleyi TaxID=1353891 RepID=UPI001490B09E|nr:sulfite exporter TauE/SafE family protein [Achromobacter deleyi]QVQ27333.1 sulfite exporter TauE/SafE family protein [Achromobacter deleyi]UIP22927.1 sulfite exporter TauE/SafE family protein [Achromobacter deleyi]
MIYLVLALFGGVSGVTTVLFGFGGGFVVVPVLYGVLTATHGAQDAIGLSAMHIAVATSTCVMIVNSVAATRKHQRAGNIVRAYVWPLAGFIGAGALLGALAATRASGDLVRYAFIAYLGVTILDCLLRQGFMAQHQAQAPRPLGQAVVVGGGVAIGAIATFLGVGGSVMTVPLLRRRGLPMAKAAAMANPLTLPVAMVGTLAYMAAARELPAALAPWIVGYVDLLAFAALALGSLAGIRLAAPLIPRIPDRLHARVYVLLLAIVMLSMLIL